MSYTDDFDAIDTKKSSPSNYDQMYADAGTKYGVSPDLIKAVATTESSGNPNAVSHDANGNPIAHGLMQFTPATAKSIGLADPYDPAQAIDAGAKLLKANLDATKGDTKQALMMYHGGTNQANWGDKTKAYPDKVLGNIQPTDLATDFDAVQAPAKVKTVTFSKKPVTPPSFMDSAYAGLGKGVTEMGLGAKEYAGKGLALLGADKYGNEMATNAQNTNRLLVQGNQPYEEAHPVANIGGQIAGNIVATAPLTGAGEVGSGINIVNRLINAAKTGATIGSLQPTTDKDSSFWGQKAVQTGEGAFGGLFGYGVGSAVGAVGGKILNAVTENGKKIISKITGTELPQALQNASPELQASVMQSLQAGKKIDPKILNNHIEADSLPIPIKLTAGQASQDPIQISTERNLRGKNTDLAYRFDDQNQLLKDNLDAISKNTAPDVSVPDNYHAGANLIDAISSKVEANKQATQQAYKALADANGGALPIDGQSFAIKANQALTSDPAGSFLPEKVQNIINQYQTGTQKMTFKDFDGLGRVLSKEARKADSSGDGNASHAIGLVRDALENMDLPANAQNLKPLLDAARQQAKKGFDLERQIPSYKSVASGSASPDDFVKKFIINGKTADIHNMANILGDNPEALQTIKTSVINHLKDKSIGQGGNFSQAAYNNAFDALKPKLSMIFSNGEIAQMKALGNTARNIQAQPTGSFVNNSNTDVSNAARNAGNVAGKLVDLATNSPVGSIANNVVQNNVAKKASNAQLSSILKTGAGIGSNSAANDFLLNRLPHLTGKAVSIPLSSLLPKSSTNTSKASAN